MSIVRKLRLSLIWMDIFPTDDSDFWIERHSQYTQDFNVAMSTIPDKALNLPWTEHQNQRFWQDYFETRKLENINEKKAWRCLMPLRYSPFVKVDTAEKPGHRVVAEGFYYPHGVAVIITFFIDNDLLLESMVDAAVEARNNQYNVTWLRLEQEIQERLPLKKLADNFFEHMRGTMFSKTDLSTLPLNDPFTIATVINAKEPLQDIMANNELHKSLEGLCTLHNLWEKNQLHPLNESTNFQLKVPSPKSHVVYGLKRSRAIWFPGYFEKHSKDRKIRILGSYHRNLTLVSLQVESLAALIQYIAGLLRQGKGLSPELEYLSKHAVETLGRLYAGAHTYRTWSAHMQISQHRDAINKVRDHFGLRELYKHEH